MVLASPLELVTHIGTITTGIQIATDNRDITLPGGGCAGVLARNESALMEPGFGPATACSVSRSNIDNQFQKTTNSCRVSGCKSIWTGYDAALKTNI
jgi:hypothetical protein